MVDSKPTEISLAEKQHDSQHQDNILPEIPSNTRQSSARSSRTSSEKRKQFLENSVDGDKILESFLLTLDDKDLYKSIKLKLTSLTDPGLKSLAAFLQKNPSTEIIQLRFTMNNSLSTAAIVEFIRCLDVFKSFERLSIAFDVCGAFDNDALELLSKIISKHTQMVGLELKIDSASINDAGVEKFAESIEKLDRLQTLELDFSRCVNFSDEALNSVALSLPGLYSLITLKICIDRCYKISDHGITHLANKLQHLAMVQELFLKMISCNISNQGLEVLGQKLMLCESKELRRVKLHCPGTKITSVGVSNFTRSLQKHPNIQVDKQAVVDVDCELPSPEKCCTIF